jgi:altronate dehydratase small subunit
MTMPKIAFVLHASDNVATVIGGDISPGDEVMLRGVGEGSLIVSVSIPDGHKFALQDISMGGSIFKYGSLIGRATAAVRRGEHVHVHNTESLRGRGDLRALGPSSKAAL